MIFNYFAFLIIGMISTNFLYSQSVVTDITRDDSGQILTIEYFNTSLMKVRLMKMETYYSNGQIQILDTYQNGKKNGDHLEYYDNGKLKKKGQFIEGDASGLWNTFYSNGKIERMFYANKNGMHGSINEWYENGEKKINGVYNNGVKDGVWISWYPTGIKESMLTYNNGNKEGVFIYYYENGNKKSEGVFDYKGEKEDSMSVHIIGPLEVLEESYLIVLLKVKYK